MASYFRALSSEWLKLSSPILWLQIILSPALALLIGITQGNSLMPWHVLVALMASMHALLFLPILTGMLGAMVCRYEHSGGGWKQLLVMPISRGAVYFAKFSIVGLILAATQLLFLGAVLVTGLFHGIKEPLPWDMIATSLLGGWAACLPLAALQLAVSTAWSSFAAPLALNVVFTIPNILVANSATYAPYYPWAQPLLAMMPSGEEGFGAFSVPFQTLMPVVIGGFLIFFIGGLVYFRRKEV
ncbi:ABC transporter permease [Paenibacillus sp. N3/727]|uniref:ABC transporter permease n=1 Tax=Paenibacillus sp. N3/727 TaxID=2925845 RepID=UPI001F53A831|nr:ABC transporter permease [Paenibacillus sp. N3/727]UNK19020.1 ABC transporter permease [Paenibacillus sp. N3/727]